MVYKLLFVCLGNICRSPAAENIMNHLIQEANLEEQIVIQQEHQVTTSVLPQIVE